MDSDLWISRLAAAKRQLALQRGAQFGRFGLEEIEYEQDARSDFPCPYCYEDHDLSSLYNHLEDEHPFESKSVACPVCAVKVTRDILDHITVQHGHMFRLQRRQRIRRFTIPTNQPLGLLGRDLQESYLKVLLGNNANRTGTGSSSCSNTPTDTFLTNVLNLHPETDESGKASAPVENYWVKKAHASKPWKLSVNSSLSLEEREQRRKRTEVRASFVRHLLASSLFGD